MEPLKPRVSAVNESIWPTEKREDLENVITSWKGKTEIVHDEHTYKDKPGMIIPEKLAKTLKGGEFQVLLTETRTIQLLHINSLYLNVEGSEEIKDTNEQELPNKKLPIKVPKIFSRETQTLQNPTRDESTITIPVITKDSSTFVSNWDFFSSKLNKTQIPMKGKGALFGQTAFEEVSPQILDEQVKKLFGRPKFKHACILTERLLASNNYRKKQSTFLESSETDFPEKCTEFKYKAKKLWAFSSEDTSDRTVTSLSWNPILKGSIAVGYGTFNCDDSIGGLVCIWSVLNPFQPEKIYNFEHSVNDVKFSKELPHLLAVASHTGIIWIIDIIRNSMTTVKGYQLQHLGPIWKMEWIMHNDLVNEEEIIISVGNDGRVCKWDIWNKFGCSLLLRLRYGPEKQISPSAIEDVKKGDRYLSAMALAIDPKHPNMYYVGTAGGYLVKCSTNMHDHFQDIFMAHQGPIYSVKFSPFFHQIILTCGGDWTMRLWIESITEPILVIRTNMEAVMGAVWSPVHSTIIASISSNELALWDISRKMLYPVRVVYIKKECIFSTIEFSDCGNNVLAGDNEGNVHVYNLQEMPYNPINQGKLFVDTMKIYLKSNPKLLEEIEKLETASSINLKTVFDNL